MIYVIYLFAGLFIVLCAVMLYVFYRDRHIGLFLMGVTYGTAGLLAIMLPHWWPLIVGFVMAWLLRLMGLEQGTQSGDEGGGMRDEGGMKEEGGRTKDEGKRDG